MHYRPQGEPLALRPADEKGLETLRTQLVHRGVHQRALRVEDQPQRAVRSSIPSRWRWFELPGLARSWTIFRAGAWRPGDRLGRACHDACPAGTFTRCPPPASGP